MDNLFSLKGKDALFVSGLLGVFIYFAFLNGDDGQNKFYYIALGYGAWIILKGIYWHFRTNSIINISRYSLSRSLKEIEKIRKIDEDRADQIERIIY